MPSLVGGVFRTLPGESHEAALQRAAAAGRSGGLLLLPGVATDAAEWERQTVAQQRALMAEAAAHIQGLPAQQPSPAKLLRS